VVDPPTSPEGFPSADLSVALRFPTFPHQAATSSQASFTPPQATRAGPRTGPLIAAVCGLIAVLGAIAVIVVASRSTPAAGPPTAQTPAAPAAATTPSQPPAIPDPAAELQQEVANDSATAESLVGTWVPQLSSKREGLVVNGTTFDDTQIWDDFQRSRNRHSDAILLRSGDFSSFRQPGYWVTVVAERFPTPDAANTWCGEQGYAAEDCFAKRLSHTDGPAGNTAPRI
jgi:serine/threonine-protein kinase